MAAADIGIAMGGAGNDVVLETAGVVLASDDLRCISGAVLLARRTERTIRLNLSFTLAVIVLLVAWTAFFALPLPLGVVGHEGSTPLVLLNSLRLVRRN